MILKTMNRSILSTLLMCITLMVSAGVLDASVTAKDDQLSISILNFDVQIDNTLAVVDFPAFDFQADFVTLYSIEFPILESTADFDVGLVSDLIGRSPPTEFNYLRSTKKLQNASRLSGKHQNVKEVLTDFLLVGNESVNLAYYKPPS